MMSDPRAIHVIGNRALGGEGVVEEGFANISSVSP